MKRSRVLLTLMALPLIVPGPAEAYERPGRTELVSVALDGEPSGDFNVYPSISSSGRYVAFVSGAANLVPGDANGVEDAFVRDRVTGLTELVSLRHDDTQQTGGTKHAIVSGEGRFVTFDSPADDLVPGDTNSGNDIFIRDRALGTTKRVSLTHDGREANGYSGLHGVSGDGRYVVFESPATNLVPGDTNGQADIFVRDLVGRSTKRVSVSSSGAQANNRSHSPSISENGRFVVFASYASNLVASDPNVYQDMFVHDRQSGVTERVSIAHDGSEPNNYSSFGVTDDAGRFVVFGSWATNLVPADTGGIYDLFVRDRVRGTTERISVSSEGAQANAGSDEPSISADGRFASFLSGASNLVPGDTNGKTDAFVRDLVTGATELVTMTDEGGQTDGHVLWRPMISAEGGDVVFVSDAPNLGGGEEVHVRSRGPAIGVGGLETRRPKGGALEVTGFATFSGGMLAEAADPAGDGTTAAGDLGADITRAAVAYQAEREQLLVRWDLASLTPSATGVGSPAVVYGLSFTVGGVRYEARAARVGATTVPPSTPSFGVYRCESTCTRTWTLAGSIGTAARGVMTAIPASSVGATDGTAFTAMRAFTGLGEASGSLNTIDEAAVAPVALPVRSVTLGVAPEDDDEEDVDFGSPLEAGGGWFAAALDTSLPEGPYRAWVRACLGAVCSARSAPFTLP